MTTATVETEELPEHWDGAEELIPEDDYIPVEPEHVHYSQNSDDENADPDAPYGRKADGTPKKKPGPQKKTGAAVPRAPRPASRGAAPRKTTTRRTSAPVAQDYREGIAGILQLIAIPLSLAGRAKPELAYDAATIVAFTPRLADFGNNTAQNEPRIAALLDKVMTIGPYGEGIAIVLAMGAQMMVNHKVLPVEVGKTMGAMEPDALMQYVQDNA